MSGADATTWLTNQPRASRDHEHLPGAAFIASIGEDWCSNRVDEIVEWLKVVRFEDPKHDDRPCCF